MKIYGRGKISVLAHRREKSGNQCLGIYSIEKTLPPPRANLSIPEAKFLVPDWGI
jgi:hypothetical protein